MRFRAMVVLAGCGHYGFAAPDNAPSDAELIDQGALVDQSALVDALPASKCSGQNVVVCEAFETSNPSWLKYETNGSVGPSTSRPLRGVGSLESATNAVPTGSSGEAAVRIDMSLAGTGSLYGRIWVYAPSPSAGVYNQFLTFAESGGAGIGIAVDASGALVSNDFGDGSYLTSATKMPLDRWSCLILEVPRNQTGVTRVYIDDVELTDIAQSNPTPQITLDQVYVGISLGNGSAPPLRMWFDELIVDTSPVSCAQ